MNILRTSASHALLLISVTSYLLDAMSGGVVSSSLALKGSDVLVHYRLWQLLSYPFAGLTLIHVAFFSVVMICAADRVEAVFPRYKFSLLLVLLTLVQGLGYVLLFPGDSAALTGTSLLSFFSLGMFAALFPKKRLEVYRGVAVSVPVFVLLVSVLSVSLSANQIVHGDYRLGIASIVQGMTGMILGMGFSWSHRRRIAKRHTYYTSAPQWLTPKVGEQLEPAEVSTTIGRTVPTSVVPQYFSDDDDDIEDYSCEDRLNTILDKILDSGSDSLSEPERRYLERYSERLRK